MKIVLLHSRLSLLKAPDTRYVSGVISSVIKSISPHWEHVTATFKDVPADSASLYNVPLNDSVECVSLGSNFKHDVLFHRRKLKKMAETLITRHDCAIFFAGEPLIWFGLPAARKAKKPYIVYVGGCFWDALWNHSLKGKLIAPFSWLIMRRQIKNAPYVWYVTSEFLQKRYPTRGFSMACSSIVLNDFDEETLDNRLKNIQTKGEGPLIIGTTASDVNVRYKGQQYVIRALGKLKKLGNTNFKYQLVGGGDQSYLRAVAQEYNVVGQVEFLGLLPYDRVFKWLDTIDIYCQPSRQEGLPKALLEAMSRGVAACGARTAGIPELLAGEFVFSNSRKEVDEIAALLVKMQSPQMRAEQAIRNFSEAKKYGKDVLDARRKKFFEKVKEDLKAQ